MSAPTPHDSGQPDAPRTDEHPREGLPDHARENLEKQPAPPDPMPDPGPL